MSALTDLLKGNDAVRQIFLWGVAFQLLEPLLAPVVQSMHNDINALDPVVPLSPADAADAVVRGELDLEEAVRVAAKSGMGDTSFATLVGITGEPPALEQLLLLFRRGDIPLDRLVHGIRQSRVKNEWIEELIALKFAPLSAEDAVAAWVEAQIPEAEAIRRARIAGVDEPEARILYNTRGRPPGIEQVIELVRRGKTPRDGLGPDALSLQQAIAESDVKTKWTPRLFDLLEYLPPPRTVTALLRAGSITAEQAGALFRDSGLSAELAAAYVADASNQKLAAHKELAKSDVLALYNDRGISAAQAHDMLAALHYTDAEIALLLRLEELKRALAQLRQAQARIRTQYVAHRIGRAQVVAALGALELPSDQVDTLLQDWDLERAVNVKIPSPATVAAAFVHGVIDQATAVMELTRQGYSEFDAWLELSVRNRGPLPDPPASSWPEPGA